MSLSVDEAKSVLDISVDKSDITKETVKTHYTNKVKETHPDQGGTTKEFNDVQDARNVLIDYIENGYLEETNKPKNNTTNSNVANTTVTEPPTQSKTPSIIDKLSVYIAKTQLLVIFAGVFTLILSGQYYPALQQISYISVITSLPVILLLVGLFFIPIVILLDINYYDNNIRQDKYTNNIVIYNKFTLFLLVSFTWGGLTIAYELLNPLYLSIIDIIALQVMIIWIYIVFRRTT